MGCCGLLIVVILTIYISLDPAVGERRLQFVTVVYRHGDRSALWSYPADTHQESAWPQGFGQLTQDGMRQHFKLGQALKKRYHGFLSEAYDRHQIVVNSTDIDRTLMSAAVNLAAMYPPNGSQIFNPNLHWQPIPIHTVQNETTLLKFPLSPCPRFQTLLNETKNTPEFINKSVQYKEFLQRLANDTGMESISLESVWRIYDTLFCEKAHNLSQPSWVTTEVMETLQQLNDFAFMCLFGIHNQEEKSRLQGGVLLKHILEHVTESAVSNSSKPLKMQAYSTHDITIVALQVALNVFNGKQPPYASCHIFELFQEDNGNNVACHCKKAKKSGTYIREKVPPLGSFSVAMFFRNDSTKEPYPLALPGCTQYCPLEEFVRLTKPIIPENWTKECNPSSDFSKELSTALTLGGCM